LIHKIPNRMFSLSLIIYLHSSDISFRSDESGRMYLSPSSRVVECRET